MSVTSGFFNSVNHDRLYDAEQISSMFDGIIYDGIYSGIGDAFIVKPYSDLNSTITVGTGRAWFDHTWTKNDTELAITLDDPNVLYDRIDCVVIDVDRRQDVRKNSIKVVKGEVSESGAVKPTLINEELHKQYPLSYITVKAGSPAPISASNMENVIGQSATPLVQAVLDHMDITMFVQQMESEFDEWFEGLKDVVSGDSITNLQQQINEINEYIELQKPVSIDGEAYLKSKDVKITTVDLGFAQMGQAFVLPDGYILAISGEQGDRKLDNYSAKIYNEDFVKVKEADLGVIYSGNDSEVQNWPVKSPSCVILENLDAYPGRVMIGYPQGSFGNSSFGYVDISITSDHTITSTKGSYGQVSGSSGGASGLALSSSVGFLNNGSRVAYCSSLTGIVAYLVKFSSDGVRTAGKVLTNREGARADSVYNSLFSYIDSSSKEMLAVYSEPDSGYSAVSIYNADTLAYVSTSWGSSSSTATAPYSLNGIRVFNNARVISTDGMNISKFTNSYQSTSDGQISPYIALQTSLEVSGTSGSYSGAVISNDSRIIVVNRNGQLSSGISLNGGMPVYTPSVSSRIMNADGNSAGLLKHKYSSWTNGTNRYVWIFSGYVNYGGVPRVYFVKDLKADLLTWEDVKTNFGSVLAVSIEVEE